MTLRLELKPEIEASLTAQARANGVLLETYLQHAIEGLARAKAGFHGEGSPAPDVQEFRTALDELAEMGKNLPHTPSSAFTRESIYRDHN